MFQEGYIGIGNVIQDASGHFLRARCGCYAGRWQPREAEAISLKTTLLWAKSLDLDHCLFESGCKGLVDACNGDKGESYFHTIVLDCLELCKHFDHCKIAFVSRSANKVVHLLATYSMSDLREWIDNPPEFLNHVLNSDLN